jgi:hypothetical protein
MKGNHTMLLVPCPDPACDMIAEIVDTVAVGSTSGPIEHLRTLCVRRHAFFLPADTYHLRTDVTCARRVHLPVPGRA